MPTRVIGPFPFQQLVISTTAASIDLGPEFHTAGVDDIDFLAHITGATGDAAALPTLRLFNDSPSTANAPTVTTGTYNGTAGTAVKTTKDISADTSKWLGQGGVSFKLDGGANPGQIRGMLWMALKESGGSLPAGRRRIEISPNEDSGHPSLFVLGPYLPVLGSTNFRAVIRGTEVADMSWRFYVRLANDTEKPETMVALGTGFTDFSPTSGNLEINTGNIDVGTGVTGLGSRDDYFFMQFILALRMKSGGSNPTGLFSVEGRLLYA